MLPIYLNPRAGHRARRDGDRGLSPGGRGGTLLGGPLSDKVGRRLVICSFAVALPFVYLFFQTGSIGIRHLATGSAVMTASAPVNTVMAAGGDSHRRWPRG